MRVGTIDRATRNLGRPRNWDEAKEGPCGSLAIRDEFHRGTNRMVSAWYPDQHELRALLDGAPIYLIVIGDIHPPVAVVIGEPPAKNPAKDAA